MAKSKKANTIKILIEGNHITEFSQIFDHVSKTRIALELGIHFTRLSKMIDDVKEIKVNDLLLLSRYFEVGPQKLFELIVEQHNKKTNQTVKRRPPNKIHPE